MPGKRSGVSYQALRFANVRCFSKLLRSEWRKLAGRAWLLQSASAKAELKKEALEIGLDGTDSGVMDKSPDYVKSIPIWKALDENTLIAARTTPRKSEFSRATRVIDHPSAQRYSQKTINSPA